jgi:surface carbohydrate biosynthesis protein (TIGR04326 family)
MTNPLIILDSNKVSLNNNNDVILWSGNHQINGAKTFSLAHIVEKNSEYFKKEYISLIYELGETVIGNKKVINHLKLEKNFSFWWTTLIVEKSNYKSTEIINAIKIIAFKHWLKKKNYTKIILYSHNSKLQKAISILCEDINLKLENKNIEEKPEKIQAYKKFYKYFPQIIQSLAWLFCELVSMWPLKGVGFEKWSHSESKITFVSSLINLDKNAVENGEYKSNYWPVLPNFLKYNNCKSNWIHFYSNTKDLPNASKARDFINKLNNSRNGIETHTSIYTFFSFFIFLRTILGLIKLFFKKLKIYKMISKKSGIVWPFIAKDFNESLTGINAARNLLYMYLFKDALANLPKQDKGFYLQENQGWECTFIHSWRIAKHNSFLFAIPHTPIKFWDLKTNIDNKTFMSASKSFLPIPDFIGVNSDISKNMHLKNGIPREKLVSIEALRYLHLNYSTNCNLKGLNQNKHTLLLLGDVFKTNTLEQIKLLKETLKYIKIPIQYLIKPHPASPISVKDCPIDIDFIITNKPINEIINCCQLVYASSTTSASFDCYYLGFKVVNIINSQGLNLSPLRGLKDAVFVRTPIELAKILNKIDKIKKNPTRKENILYLDMNIPKWRNILGID